MDQIRANTPAPIKANLMTEQLSVQMSWGNGGCTRAGSPGDQQSRELGPWAARRSRAMMRANAWGHDELSKFRCQKFGLHHGWPKNHSGWALWSHRTNGIWRVKQSRYWLEPSNQSPPLTSDIHVRGGAQIISASSGWNGNGFIWVWYNYKYIHGLSEHID